jgi:hypothetical protein
MKLFIPSIGTEIKLSEPWKFKLYGEYRNQGMFEYLGEEYPKQSWSMLEYIRIEFPIGTILKVDRLYIRKGNEKFNSVTFFLIDGKKGRKRFWAKLDDVNRIVMEDIPTIGLSQAGSNPV